MNATSKQKKMLVLGEKASSLFTLVEMLVVIAIIGILAALLMPALQKALAASRQVHCANNLRNNHAAARNYADDNYGFIISSYTNSWGTIFLWPRFITGYTTFTAGGGHIDNAGKTPYINIRDRVLDCAARPGIDANIGTNNSGYGIYQREWATTNTFKWRFTSGVVLGTDVYKTLNLLHLNRVSAPSQIAMFADTMMGKTWWSSRDRPSIANFTCHGTSNWGGRVMLIHGGMANIGFFDGHVELRDSVSLYDDPQTNMKFFYTESGESLTYP